jgi:hypothetical protein
MKVSAPLLLLLLLTSFALALDKPTASQSGGQKDMNHLEELKVEQSPVFQHKPLYYYHKFLKEHNQVSNKVPLQQHYANERRFRIERDNLLNKVDALSRKKGFQVRDTEHAVLKIENQIASAKTSLSEVNKIATQRETAVKFEINHDEMWKKYYQKRLSLNQGKLSRALPDDASALKKLIANDEQRVAYYLKSANDQWESLKNLKAKHNSEVVKLQNTIDRLENEETTTGLRGAQATRHLVNQIRKVKELIKPISETLDSDDKLDIVRKAHEKIEMEKASHPEDAQKATA